jgi:hypothetical protein
MDKQDDFDKKMEESRRLREINRKKLEHSDELIERVNIKLAQVKKLRQSRTAQSDEK